MAFTFVGSAFTVDASWDIASSVNVTVDGVTMPVPIPVNLSSPLEGKLVAGVHSVNVSVVGGVRMAGVTLDGPTDLTEVDFTLDGELAVVDGLTWDGEWVIANGIAPYALAEGKEKTHVAIELPENTGAFELRGLVAPGAGNFTIDIYPPAMPTFEGNTDSEITDHTTLLYTVMLDRHERYTVNISPTAGSIHLGSWGYALDCGGECLNEPPIRPQTRSANSTSAITFERDPCAPSLIINSASRGFGINYPGGKQEPLPIDRALRIAAGASDSTFAQASTGLA
ncbi:hypothetical protein CspHIS471_0502930 [Cutaneotrichosporon sp. HIS471]|nr:hypothetical protein CspHIS471_0502930 [Cutaneotrichosporon sp. HIS471]